jgi:hypothetical protein
MQKEELDETLRSPSSSSTVLITEIRNKYWYWAVVRLYCVWYGESIEASRRMVDNTIVPLYIHYGTSFSLLPERESVRKVFNPSRQPSAELLHQMLPLALGCCCLTAFILPLYDGMVIYLLRWTMTIVSAFIGPRLSNGMHSLMGVLIFGLMMNKPLGVCTIGLGAWASFFLGLVMTKALGIRPLH